MFRRKFTVGNLFNKTSLLQRISYTEKRNTAIQTTKIMLHRNTTEILILITLLLFSKTAFPAEKIFDHQVDQPFSGSQSPDDAYMAAITKAKYEVLEQAGTYLESLTVVENAVLSRDEVTALAGGIMKTEIVSIKNYATPQSFGIVLSTRIVVDTSILKSRMEKLLFDRTLLKKYNEIQQREQELLEKIKQLEQKNKKRNSIALRPVKIQNDFSAISAALSASRWIKKAIALWSNGNFTSPAKAVEYLTRALELDPQNPRTYNSRAIAYLNLNQEEKAREDLEHALRLNPQYVDAFNNLGSLHYRRGEYEAAINNYTQALQYQPDFVEAILNRGMASRKLFNFEDAFEDFKQVMHLAPETFIKKDRAGALVQLNDLQQLCRKSETACKMNLCRSLTFLQKRGFCLNSENQQQ